MLAPLHPRRKTLQGGLCQLLLENIEEVCQVGGNAEVRAHGGLVQFGGVDIDLSHPSVLGECLPVITGLSHIQTRPQHQHKISRLQAEVAGTGPDSARAAGEQRVVGRDQIMGPGGRQGDAVALHQRQ